MQKNKPEIDNSPVKRQLLMHTSVIYLCVVVLGIAMLVRVIDLQFFEREALEFKLEQAKARQIIHNQTIPVKRGDILSLSKESNQFVPLVQEALRYSISIDPDPHGANKKGDIVQNIPDSIFNKFVSSLSDSLTSLFGKPKTETWAQKLRKARKEGKHYFLITDQASISQQERVKTFPIFNENKKYNALIIKKETDKSNYPYEDLARRTLGEAKEHDLVGIEGFFDLELSGVPGKKMVKKLSSFYFDMDDKDDIVPQPGLDVVTTLDMTIQAVAHNSLLEYLQKNKAYEGCAVVMEVATGNILAIANISKDKNGIYREIRNIALDNYEPGSTFKTASLLVALDDGKISANSKIPVLYKAGRLQDSVGHRRVTDFDDIKKKDPEVWYIFAESSNVGTTKAIHDSYVKNQQQFIDGLCRLGFCDSIEIPVIGGKKCPLLRTPSDPLWSKLTISTIPMGYELEVTPLHLLTFYNAIANNGRMVAPRLVTELRSKDSIVRSWDVVVLKDSICSEKALKQIRGMLDSVVASKKGTGHKGFLGKPYRVAGKTGTSRIYSPDNHGKIMYNSSFCGYFPSDDPKYSCVVVIKKTNTKDYTGAKVALPVFRDIADKLTVTDKTLMPIVQPPERDIATFDIIAKAPKSVLDAIFQELKINAIYKQKLAQTSIENTGQWNFIRMKDNNVQRENLSFSDKIMPDVMEMSLTDALYILEKNDLSIEIKGYGKVKSQSPEANTPILKNKKVLLHLGL